MRNVAALLELHPTARTLEGHPEQALGSGSPRDPRAVRRLLQSPDRAHLRREFNRASRAGMSSRPWTRRHELDEILAINRSAETRQGRPMHPQLPRRGEGASLFRTVGRRLRGHRRRRGLRAYVCVRVCGEVACVERILGHADVLKPGVMWVSLPVTMRELVERRQTQGLRRGSCTTRTSGHLPDCDNSSNGSALSRTGSRGHGGR